LQIKLIISKENINIKYVDQNICYNSTIFQNITWVSIAMIYYIIYKYTIYKKKKKKTFNYIQQLLGIEEALGNLHHL